jgi:hypothetical protein
LRRLHSFSSVLPPAGESGTSCEEAFRLELKEHPLYKAGGIGSFISPSWDSPACQQLRGNDGEGTRVRRSGARRVIRPQHAAYHVERRIPMYATIRRYEDVTDPAEAGRRVSEDFVPLIKEIPGFIAYYWVDAGEGVMASTSVFEDRAGAKASTERAAEWVGENIASLLPSPPIVVAGEVVASA